MNSISILLLFLFLNTASGQTIPVGKGPDALFLTPDERYLYVANVEDTFISVIDTRTDKMVQTIDGVDYPWGFTRLGETNLVAVSGWDKGIDVIDFTTHKIMRSKRYEQNLGGITSTNDGKTLFVVATEANKVLKIDGNTLNIVAEYETGSGPDGVGISKDNQKIYVTNTKDGSISIINVDTKTSKVIKTGGKPELIHGTLDHSLLFIGNFSDNKVHILDTETDKIIHEITGLAGPEEAVLSKSGETLLVVNFNSAKVFSYDAKNYKKRPEEFAVGSKPIGIVTTAEDSKLYVSNFGDNSVSVITMSKTNGTVKTAATEILVKFKPGVQEAQIKTMASQIGLQQVKAIPALNLRVFKITSPKSLHEVIDSCQKLTFVEYAEPNLKYQSRK